MLFGDKKKRITSDSHGESSIREHSVKCSHIILETVLSVLLIRLGIRGLFDPWIRDPGWVKNLDPDPGWKRFGSGIQDKHPGSSTLGSISKHRDDWL
jgi:hypothetical protein